MHIIDWVLIAFVILSLGVVGYFIWTKKKQLTLLDLEAMPKAKQKSQKYKIVEDRLQRKKDIAKITVKKVFSPLAALVGSRLKAVVQKLNALERKYRHAEPEPQTQEDKEKTRKKIIQLMEQGEELFKEENFGEAEHLFLDVIRLDEKNVEAYEYLGEVYLQMKDYEHSVETLKFAQKLSPDDDRTYYDLGRVFQVQNDHQSALKYFKECVRLSPRNPRNLSSLLLVAIELKEGVLAKQVLQVLKEVNPENQKIQELEEMVREM